jgi:hypothetical protein
MMGNQWVGESAPRPPHLLAHHFTIPKYSSAAIELGIWMVESDDMVLLLLLNEDLSSPQ